MKEQLLVIMNYFKSIGTFYTRDVQVKFLPACTLVSSVVLVRVVSSGGTSGSILLTVVHRGNWSWYIRVESIRVGGVLLTVVHHGNWWWYIRVESVQTS